MIQLRPNRRYKIFYSNGEVFSYGDTAFFETLDTIPETKHLIRVKDVTTGEIVDLADFLAHPWLRIEETEGK